MMWHLICLQCLKNESVKWAKEVKTFNSNNLAHAPDSLSVWSCTVCSVCNTKQNYSALLRQMMRRRMGTSTFLSEANPKFLSWNKFWRSCDDRRKDVILSPILSPNPFPPQKKKELSMTRHSQVDLLMCDLLPLKRAVLFNFFSSNIKLLCSWARFSKSKVNLVQSSF